MQTGFGQQCGAAAGFTKRAVELPIPSGLARRLKQYDTSPPICGVDFFRHSVNAPPSRQAFARPSPPVCAMCLLGTAAAAR
jgi:hypothetical protein